MKIVSHKSAKASHYNNESENYDAFNESNSFLINTTLEAVLKKYDVQTVLDLTCGTGSQVFWLTRCGFQVVGSDINAKMLEIAKRKAYEENLDITFIKGDMRSVQVGEFDAVITIFNSIGHLTKDDFEKAIQNVRGNLKKGGLYIFDIANLNYYLKDDHISELTIDWIKTSGNTRLRDIQYSTLSLDGVITFHTTSIVQKDSENPKVTKSTKTLQLYTAQQLKDLLNKNHFRVIDQCDIDGSQFIEERTDRILTVARKQE